ncbi:uncharacterized protein LOC144051757 isoform X3 [Vanacampus margaritifer]
MDERPRAGRRPPCHSLHAGPLPRRLPVPGALPEGRQSASLHARPQRQRRHAAFRAQRAERAASDGRARVARDARLGRAFGVPGTLSLLGLGPGHLVERGREEAGAAGGAQILRKQKAAELQIRRRHRGERPADPELWPRGPRQDVQLLRLEPARIPDVESAAGGGRSAPGFFLFRLPRRRQEVTWSPAGGGRTGGSHGQKGVADRWANAARLLIPTCRLHKASKSSSGSIASVPWVELACGASAMLVTWMLLLALYRVFRLELLLLYRSRFGTDERHADDKEFDVYISYARNSEEEEFVLTTLRRVLENDLGYAVCIFDRDSLPGGTITDETLSFVARSRRLVVVLGPGYARQGSQALLELKAGVDGLAGGHLRLILLQYKRVRRHECVRELRRARVALAVVRWQGEPSREMTSRFWKKLRLELPVRRLPGTRRGDDEGGKEAGLMTTPDRDGSPRERSTSPKSPSIAFAKGFSTLGC